MAAVMSRDKQSLHANKTDKVKEAHYTQVDADVYRHLEPACVLAARAVANTC